MQSRKLWSCLAGVVIVSGLLSRGMLRADDAYYLVPLSDIESAAILDKPLEQRVDSFRWQFSDYSPSHVSVNMGEAYVLNGENPLANPQVRRDRTWLAIRAPKGQEIRGVLAWNGMFGTTTPPIAFSVTAEQASDHREQFLQAKDAYFRTLVDLNSNGAPWFQRQIGMTGDATPNNPRWARRMPRRGLWGDDPMDLFTGGRAFAENVQLDRNVRGSNELAATEDVAKIQGITVAEMDWKQYPTAAEAELDPLAKCVPRDQHALFCQSFEDFLKVMDEFNRTGGKFLELTQPSSTDYAVGKHYESQLGTPPTEFARTVGKQFIDSVVITGGDLYFEQGTDIAIVFETKSPSALAKLLETRVAASAALRSDVSNSKGKFGTVEYVSFVTPDREMSSFVAALQNAVVLTNSPAQLRRLAELTPAQSLAELPDYRFFRKRYPRGAEDETGLVFISDPTLRRWCGPAARIGQARRLMAFSELASLQAAEIESQTAASADATQREEMTPQLGKITRTGGAVKSELYNTLGFETPLAELPIEKVTKAEAAAYEAWRTGYESNWNWRFDPIALKLSVSPTKFAADLTVMPLIANNSYQEMTAVSRGSKLTPTSADPHEALFQFAMAINPESPPVRMASSFLAGAMMRNGPTLDWLGKSITIYADPDPIWEELLKLPFHSERETQKFFEDNFQKLPLGLRIEAASTPKLLLFLTAARAYIEQSGPGMTSWGTEQVGEHTVAKITISNQVTGKQVTPHIYYATMDNAVLVSPNLQLIERAFARADERAKPDYAPPKATWIGDNVGLVSRPLDVAALSSYIRSVMGEAFREAAWRNLPILNEWKRLFPKEDPVAVHQRYWQATLVDPSGGKYVWNEEYQTMESTTWGHPAAPKTPATIAVSLENIERGQFGLTFEPDGLRARFTLQRNGANAEKK